MNKNSKVKLNFFVEKYRLFKYLMFFYFKVILIFFYKVKF
jgi:hypothetical protein